MKFKKLTPKRVEIILDQVEAGYLRRAMARYHHGYSALQPKSREGLSRNFSR